MTFQPGSQNPAGEVLYDDGLQQFLRASSMQAPSMQAPSMQQYAAEPFYYLSQSSSSVPYQSVEHDYTRICPQTFSEDLLPQPSPESDTVQKKASDEILSALDELKQGITSVQTKCDELAATISKLHDWYAFHQPKSQIQLIGAIG